MTLDQAEAVGTPDYTSRTSCASDALPPSFHILVAQVEEVDADLHKAASFSMLQGAVGGCEVQCQQVQHHDTITRAITVTCVGKTF
jgi:hypothetical protein